MMSGQPLFIPSPQMLSHMCGITRAEIKLQDFTVLNVFYLSFAERLCFTEETHHLSAGPENRGHFPAPLWTKGIYVAEQLQSKHQQRFTGQKVQIAT